MHRSVIFFLSLAPHVLAMPARGCRTAASAAAAANGKAIYMITNDQANAVVAIPIGNDGLLQAAGASRTTTGGAGANGIDGSVNQPAAPDALFSQSSLTIAGNVRGPCLPGLLHGL